MANEDGSIWLVLNGELYNFRTLRRELETRGHVFKSNSDSEVALHLYEEVGPSCVRQLRGMFAIALWDGRLGRLLLARDAFGKKPLYYHFGARGLVFASELQALCASRAVPLDIDPAAIDAYLTLQYIPAPLTVFRGVRKLEPGHLIVARPGVQPESQQYFRLQYGAASQATSPTPDADLLARLDEAVRLRMISDVALGALLSGGIDSSAVVALMARHSLQPIKTFWMGFSGDDPAEPTCARLVAARYGTDHHELIVTPDAAQILPALVRHFGEPFADCSAIPTWYLCRFARAHVTVALSGDGGDEGFAGYTRYLWARVARAIRALPPPLRTLVATLLRFAPTPALWPLREFGRRLSQTEVERYLGLVAHFPLSDRLSIYTPEMRARFASDAVRGMFERLLDAGTVSDPVDRLLELDVATYLPGAVLAKVDVTSMAHGLEVRCPLLDQEVMELAASIPSRDKLSGLKPKAALRKVLRPLLPREVLNRPKRGFDPPIDRWMRHELAPMTRDLLLDHTARSRGWFEPSAVEALLVAHQRGEPRGLQIWTLLVLEQWFRTFVDRRPQPEGSR